MASDWTTKCESPIPREKKIRFWRIEANNYFYMPSFEKNIQKSTTDALDLETTIARIFENLVRANSEFDKIQGSQLRESHGLATDLKTKLEKLQDNEVDGLFAAFGSIYNQLVSKNVSKKKEQKKTKTNLHVHIYVLEEHSLIQNAAKHE